MNTVKKGVMSYGDRMIASAIFLFALMFIMSQLISPFTKNSNLSQELSCSQPSTTEHASYKSLDATCFGNDTLTETNRKVLRGLYNFVIFLCVSIPAIWSTIVWTLFGKKEDVALKRKVIFRITFFYAMALAQVWLNTH